MKPTLNWTKSKVEAHAPGAAIQYSPFWLKFQRMPAVEGAPAVSRRSMVTSNETRKRATFKSLAAAGAL
jgi:hypothetical protein